MSRWWGPVTLALGLVVVGAVALSRVSVPWAINFAVGAAAFGWAVAVLTLPWNLHFQARSVLRELRRSERAGLAPKVDPTEIRQIARRTLGVAIGMHLLSALTVLVLAGVTNWPWGYWVAAGYLVSTAFRPVGAWYAQLREYLRRSMGEVTHPREDVVELRDRVRALEYRCDGLRDQLASARTDAEAATAALTAAHQRVDRQLEAITRRFETVVSELTDNKDLLAGLRAFLRMVRQPES